MQQAFLASLETMVEDEKARHAVEQAELESELESTLSVKPIRLSYSDSEDTASEYEDDVGETAQYELQYRLYVHGYINNDVFRRMRLVGNKMPIDITEDMLSIIERDKWFFEMQKSRVRTGVSMGLQPPRLYKGQEDLCSLVRFMFENYNVCALVGGDELQGRYELLNQHYRININNPDSYGNVKLRNPGATCYFNSVVQALMHTQPFVRLLLSRHIITSVDGYDSIIKAPGPNGLANVNIFWLLFQLTYCFYYRCRPVVAPYALQLYTTILKPDEFHYSNQSDSHEMLMMILGQCSELCDREYLPFSTNDKSRRLYVGQVSYIFSTLKMISLTCNHCMYENIYYEYENMMDINISSYNTLKNNFDKFVIARYKGQKNPDDVFKDHTHGLVMKEEGVNFNKELFQPDKHMSSYMFLDNTCDAMDKVTRCQHCNRNNMVALKRKKLMNLPPVLICWYKTTFYDSHSNTFKKVKHTLTSPVVFSPVQSLSDDLKARYISQKSPEKFKYILTSQSIHEGSSDKCGHYVTNKYFYDFRRNDWQKNPVIKTYSDTFSPVNHTDPRTNKNAAVSFSIYTRLDIFRQCHTFQ